MNSIKEKFLLEKDVVFLNHGSFGSCPKPIFANYQYWQKLLESQPVQFLHEYLYPGLKKSRIALGNFIGCSDDEIVFFQMSADWPMAWVIQPETGRKLASAV